MFSLSPHDLDWSSERRQRSARPPGVSDPLEQDQEVAGEFGPKTAQSSAAAVNPLKKKEEKA